MDSQVYKTDEIVIETIEEFFVSLMASLLLQPCNQFFIDRLWKKTFEYSI